MTRHWAAIRSLHSRTAAGLGLAILSAGVALLITRSLTNPLFPTPLFFAAIVLSSWYGGVIPGR